MQQRKSPPVAIGEIVAGKYRVERVLGAGGMGIVVAAQHIELRQMVAIKFVLPDALENAEAVERFIREARAAVRLRSEHVARVLDVGTLKSGAPYMVMELLEGFDLEQVLTREGPLPVEKVAQCIIQACEALAEAHSLGIVHRDLKPQNLFLTRSVGGTPHLKVLDFGVSKIDSFGGTRGLTRTQAMMGSPLYMAPEQMRSARDATARSDIWALGVILYRLLTGRLPFDAESMPELCLKVALEPPVPLRSLRADLPPALEAIVMHCLAKEPAQRLGGAAELAAALEPFAPPAARFSVDRADQIAKGMRPPGPQEPTPLPGPGVPTPRPGPREPTPEPWSSSHVTKSRRRPWHIGVAIAALAFAGGVAFLLLDFSEDPPVRASGPATLQSTTLTFAASSATAKASPAPSLQPAPAPAYAPPPDAGKLIMPRPRAGSPPAREDDIPTMR